MSAITYNTIVSTDLRTSGGHSMKILEVVGINGSYTAGGIILDPAEFGFSEILSFQIQPNVIGPSDVEDEATWTQPWLPLANLTACRTDMNLDGNMEWRLIILLHPAGFGGTQGDGLMELPDGTPMIFFPQIRPTLTIIGK
jgi:hypothetical protein